MKYTVILSKDANMNKQIKTFQINNVKDNDEMKKIVAALKNVYGARFANWF